jgi:hypothetical protein
MRLLHSASLEMRDFYGDQIPKYAILSHTWGDGEVTFQDMCNITSRPEGLKTNTSKFQAGYNKITSFALQARRDDFEYIWVDTCNIDKTSSAELSEAINSM